MEPVILGSAFSVRRDAASLLGVGAFASVYKGLDLATGAPVAVKALQQSHVKRDELDLIRRIDSDFVVRIFGLFEEPSDFFVVMEMCDCTLEAHLERRLEAGHGPLRNENMRTLIYCLGQGYAAIHRASIIHRDLKPENVLVCYAKGASADSEDSEGLFASVKIADFGSSRLSNGSERLENLAGTPLYMAPEVGANCLGESAYDAQVDMWSLGVLFYQAAVGSLPFDERRLCKLFLHAGTGNFEAYVPPTLPAATPPLVAELVLSLLRLNPKARFSPEQLQQFSEQFNPNQNIGQKELQEDKPNWRHFLVKNILTYFRDYIL